MIDWTRITETEDALIRKCVDRASQTGIPMPSATDLAMDLRAAHLDTPLDLERLLAADDFNFAHDVTGIMHHMDRDSGKLRGHFHPRYAKG